MFGNITFDKDHDAHVIPFPLSKVIVWRILFNIRYLLERIVGVAVHDDGNIGAVPADVDVLLAFGIGAAVEAGSAGLAAGIPDAVFD